MCGDSQNVQRTLFRVAYLSRGHNIKVNAVGIVIAHQVV